MAVDLARLHFMGRTLRYNKSCCFASPWIIFSSLLICSMHIPATESTAQVHINFWTYNNTDLVANSSCCSTKLQDDACASVCNYTIQVCLGNSESLPCDVFRTNLGYFGLQEMPLNFSDFVANPVLFGLAKWQGSVLVTIYINDTGTDRLVDFQQFRFNRSTPFTGHVDSTDYTQYNLPDDVHSQPSLIRMSLSAAVTCDMHFYTDTCDVYCRDSESCDGHYTCEPITGDRICVSGWEGPHCNVSLASGVKCSDEDSSEATDNVFASKDDEQTQVLTPALDASGFWNTGKTTAQTSDATLASLRLEAADTTSVYSTFMHTVAGIDVVQSRGSLVARDIQPVAGLADMMAAESNNIYVAKPSELAPTWEAGPFTATHHTSTGESTISPTIEIYAWTQSPYNRLTSSGIGTINREATIQIPDMIATFSSDASVPTFTAKENTLQVTSWLDTESQTRIPDSVHSVSSTERENGGIARSNPEVWHISETIESPTILSLTEIYSTFKTDVQHAISTSEITVSAGDAEIFVSHTSRTEFTTFGTDAVTFIEPTRVIRITTINAEDPASPMSEFKWSTSQPDQNSRDVNTILATAVNLTQEDMLAALSTSVNSMVLSKTTISPSFIIEDHLSTVITASSDSTTYSLSTPDNILQGNDNSKVSTELSFLQTAINTLPYTDQWKSVMSFVSQSPAAPEIAPASTEYSTKRIVHNDFSLESVQPSSSEHNTASQPPEVRETIQDNETNTTLTRHGIDYSESGTKVTAVTEIWNSFTPLSTISEVMSSIISPPARIEGSLSVLAALSPGILNPSETATEQYSMSSIISPLAGGIEGSLSVLATLSPGILNPSETATEQYSMSSIISPPAGGIEGSLSVLATLSPGILNPSETATEQYSMSSIISPPVGIEGSLSVLATLSPGILNPSETATEQYSMSSIISPPVGIEGSLSVLATLSPVILNPSETATEQYSMSSIISPPAGIEGSLPVLAALSPVILYPSETATEQYSMSSIISPPAGGIDGSLSVLAALSPVILNPSETATEQYSMSSVAFLTDGKMSINSLPSESDVWLSTSSATSFIGKDSSLTTMASGTRVANLTEIASLPTQATQLTPSLSPISNTAEVWNSVTSGLLGTTWLLLPPESATQYGTPSGPTLSAAWSPVSQSAEVTDVVPSGTIKSQITEQAALNTTSPYTTEFELLITTRLLSGSEVQLPQTTNIPTLTEQIDSLAQLSEVSREILMVPSSLSLTELSFSATSALGATDILDSITRAGNITGPMSFVTSTPELVGTSLFVTSTTELTGTPLFVTARSELTDTVSPDLAGTASFVTLTPFETFVTSTQAALSLKPTPGLSDTVSFVTSTPVETFVTSTPVETFVTSTPVETFVTSTPVETFVTSTPVETFVTSAPVETFVTSTPVETFVTSTPVETFVTSTQAALSLKPTPGLSGTVSFVTSTPVETFVTSTPVETFVTSTPVVRFVTSTPVETFVTSTPVETFVTSTPVETFVTSAPVETFVTSAPVETFVTSAPVETFVTSTQAALSLTPTPGLADTVSFVTSTPKLTDTMLLLTSISGVNGTVPFVTSTPDGLVSFAAPTQVVSMFQSTTPELTNMLTSVTVTTKDNDATSSFQPVSPRTETWLQSSPTFGTSITPVLDVTAPSALTPELSIDTRLTLTPLPERTLWSSLTGTSLHTVTAWASSVPTETLFSSLTPVPAITAWSSSVPTETLFSPLTPVPTVTAWSSLSAATLYSSLTPLPDVTAWASSVPTETLFSSLTPVPAITAWSSSVPTETLYSSLTPLADVTTWSSSVPVLTLWSSLTPLPPVTTWFSSAPAVTLWWSLTPSLNATAWSSLTPLPDIITPTSLSSAPVVSTVWTSSNSLSKSASFPPELSTQPPPPPSASFSVIFPPLESTQLINSLYTSAITITTDIFPTVTAGNPFVTMTTTIADPTTTTTSRPTQIMGELFISGPVSPKDYTALLQIVRESLMAASQPALACCYSVLIDDSNVYFPAQGNPLLRLEYTFSPPAGSDLASLDRKAMIDQTDRRLNMTQVFRASGSHVYQGAIFGPDVVFNLEMVGEVFDEEYQQIGDAIAFAWRQTHPACGCQYQANVLNGRKYTGKYGVELTRTYYTVSRNGILQSTSVADQPALEDFVASFEKPPGLFQLYPRAEAISYDLHFEAALAEVANLTSPAGVARNQSLTTEWTRYLQENGQCTNETCHVTISYGKPKEHYTNNSNEILNLIYFVTLNNNFIKPSAFNGPSLQGAGSSLGSCSCQHLPVLSLDLQGDVSYFQIMFLITDIIGNESIIIHRNYCYDASGNLVTHVIFKPAHFETTIPTRAQEYLQALHLKHHVRTLNSSMPVRRNYQLVLEGAVDSCTTKEMETLLKQAWTNNNKDLVSDDISVSIMKVDFEGSVKTDGLPATVVDYTVRVGIFDASLTIVEAPSLSLLQASLSSRENLTACECETRTVLNITATGSFTEGNDSLTSLQLALENAWNNANKGYTGNITVRILSVKPREEPPKSGEKQGTEENLSQEEIIVKFIINPTDGQPGVTDRDMSEPEANDINDYFKLHNIDLTVAVKDESPDEYMFPWYIPVGAVLGVIITGMMIYMFYRILEDQKSAEKDHESEDPKDFLANSENGNRNVQPVEFENEAISKRTAARTSFSARYGVNADSEGHTEL